MQNGGRERTHLSKFQQSYVVDSKPEELHLESSKV